MLKRDLPRRPWHMDRRQLAEIVDSPRLDSDLRLRRHPGHGLSGDTVRGVDGVRSTLVGAAECLLMLF